MKYYAIFFLWLAGSMCTAAGAGLKSLDGELVFIDDELKKGPVVLDFWTTWCKPCVKNLPALQNIYERYADKGLQVLAVNEDGPRSVAKVGPFVRAMGLTFPVLLDPDREWLRKYNINGFPTTLLLDRDGEIKEIISGYRPGDHKILEKSIVELLND